jgi:hypothetical protein
MGLRDKCWVAGDGHQPYPAHWSWARVDQLWGKMLLHTPLGGGSVRLRACAFLVFYRDLLPTKTSWLFSQSFGRSPCFLSAGSQVSLIRRVSVSPAFKVGKLGACQARALVGGVAVFNCVWYCVCANQVVFYFILFFSLQVGGLMPCCALMSCPVNQALSSYITSRCMECI